MIEQKQERENQQEVEMNFKEIAEKNFEKWNEALLTGKPEKVAELYSESCTFLPTVSGEFKKGREEAEGYFEHFLEKNPSGVIKSQAVQPLAVDSYLHSGMYDFEVDNPDKPGERKIVEARFSYVWKKETDGEWRVIHHHSSVKP